MSGRKIFNIIISVIAAVVVLASAYMGLTKPYLARSAGGSGWSNNNSVTQIKRRGYIRIGVYGDLPPYGWVNSQGKRVGFDLRLARELAKELGVKPRFTQLNGNNRVDALNSNKVDMVLANFTKTPERAEVVDFAHPYMKVSTGVVSPKSHPITSEKQLRGKQLILLKGSTGENYFANRPGIKLLRFDSETQQFNAMKNKRGAALADDNSYLYAWIKKNPQYVVGIRSIGPHQFIAPAVKKGNKSLLKWTNKQINRLTAEGFFKKDYQIELKPYFGKGIVPSDILLK
ncbi:transporter substrate-binding domain-containing protein [Lactobacillus amylovorus]|uniref:transporter substrate-binding domain-containing protein n=1 Tax=Lactobacillus amylovorus TaxID=1604 RepID=UPI00313E9991|nr:transporter substrate-binding domain-containing protein [Lactobacillus amylovorus]